MRARIFLTHKSTHAHTHTHIHAHLHRTNTITIATARRLLRLPHTRVCGGVCVCVARSVHTCANGANQYVLPFSIITNKEYVYREGGVPGMGENALTYTNAMT